ncbi:MAG TPA: hypothetical protein VGP40_05365, partial [Chthoniobacterales bacterium]|nr:hypothetical protein [Chthoniobacterales bacterium]
GLVLGLNADGFELCLLPELPVVILKNGAKPPPASSRLVELLWRVQEHPAIGAIVLFGELRKSNDVVWGQVVARGEPKASGCTMFR